jgi:hypothetical protein
MNDQIMEILRVLAEKFGTTTEFLWGVMIRQAYIHGVTAIVCFLFTSVLVFGWNWVWWRAKISNEEINSRDQGDRMFAIFMCRLGGLLFSFIWVCFFLSGMFEVATALINPEYWVIQQVLKGLK